MSLMPYYNIQRLFLDRISVIMQKYKTVHVLIKKYFIIPLK